MTIQALLGSKGEDKFYTAVLKKSELKDIKNISIGPKNILKLNSKTKCSWVCVELEMYDESYFRTGFLEISDFNEATLYLSDDISSLNDDDTITIEITREKI